MPAAFWITAGVTAVAVVVCVTAANPAVSAASKMAASTAFLAAALAAGALHNSYGLALMLGLCLSWWGDLLLLSEREALFLLGLLSFLLAHMAYAAAFTLPGLDATIAAIAAFVLLAPLTVIVRWLRPHLRTL